MSTTSELRKGWFRYALTQCRDNSTVAMTDDEITAEWGLVRAERLSELERENAALRAELSAAVGYMMNARIDLETGCTKATTIKTVSGGIDRARAALAGSGEK